ncbi:MAG TPA: hypothetical protein DD621_03245 [Clostridiales bacterium]|nr:hypothetical protein [Clostridiales bacterium]
MDLEIVKFIQSGSNWFLDQFFSAFTHFGEEIFFICMFLIFYWCVSYRYAFKFSLFYLTSVLFNNIIKLCVKRPRPWQASQLVDNKLQASGYSFPSGHSQSISCISTFIVYDIYKDKNNNKSTKVISLVIAILLCLIVGYSRMYLGQHYLTDVLTGFTLGVGIMLLLKYIESVLSKKERKPVNIEMVVSILSIVMLVLITLLQFKVFNVSLHAAKKIYRYSALLTSVSIGYILSIRLVKDVRLNIYLRLIKVAIGLIITFGLFAIFNMLVNNLFMYFLVILMIGIVATFVYPYLFNMIYCKLKKEEICKSV